MTEDLVVYDNGGKTLDRYTIVHKKRYRRANNQKLYYAVGASETGSGFFQHCEAARGRHLGKVISFSELSLELQKMIIDNF